MTSEETQNLLSRKKEAKKELAKMLGLNAKKPLIGVFLDGEIFEKDVDKIKTVLEGTGALSVNVVVLCDKVTEGSEEKHVKFLPYSRVNRSKLLSAADIALSLGFNDVEEMLLNGTVPVSEARPELEDYNPNHESGNGFIFREFSPWSIFAATVRALETFKFPYDWQNIVRSAASPDFQGR